MKRYCLTLDLKNDPELINSYLVHHQHVWPEVIRSIRDSGILQMEIFHIHTRLFMIMEVDDSFTFERKQKMDADNPKVQEWETLMEQYQQRLPFAKAGEKWVLMEKIFEL